MVNKQPNFDVMSPKERRQYEAETGKKIPVVETVSAEPEPQNVITTFGVGKTAKPKAKKAAKGKKK
tara:strand:- start:3315 stop:3512 length:198 start_codon:yes stop_codon:yes gene_type:complete